MSAPMILIDEEEMIGSRAGVYGGSGVYLGNMTAVDEIDTILLGAIQGINSGAVVNMGLLAPVDEIEDILSGSREFLGGGWIVNAGQDIEVPIGAKPPLPADNMLLIDYIDDYGGDFIRSFLAGGVMIPVSIMQSIILGRIGDTKLGYSGIGRIDFLVFNQYKDLV